MSPWQQTQNPDLAALALTVDCPFCGAAAGQPCNDIDGLHAEFICSEGIPESAAWAHGKRIGAAVAE